MPVPVVPRGQAPFVQRREVEVRGSLPVSVPPMLLRWWTRSERDSRFCLSGVAASYWQVMHEGREAVLAQSIALNAVVPRDLTFGASAEEAAA